MHRSFLLRSDNGLVFTSRSYTAMVRGYGLRQQFITPHCPHRHRFESQQHASRVIGDWIQFYNHRRRHQALHEDTR